MEVKEIIYNWHQRGSIHKKLGLRDKCYFYRVGKDGVVSIQEHQAAGEGDKWNYLVEFEDGNYVRIFNPNIVVYFKSNENELEKESH